MSSTPLSWRPTPHNLFHSLRDRVKLLARLSGHPSGGMITQVTQDGRPVLFMHNPKTGGKSLRSVLGVTRLSHTPPSQRLSQARWEGAFIITAVRDPYERFLSGYFDHVVKPKMQNALTRMYGPAFKSCSPFEYLEVLKANPKFGGPQRQWTDYPSAAKPRADLILRFEEIGQWCSQLRAAGVTIGPVELPHRNASSRAQADLGATMRLSPSGLLDLEECVRATFREDAVAFGYPLAAFTPDPTISAGCSELQPA